MTRIFSFEGRIGRMEYFFSMVILGVLNAIISGVMDAWLIEDYSTTGFLVIFGLYLIFAVWVGLAQSVKRSHDIGNSGWYILIPFYGFWLLFSKGKNPTNETGE